MEFPEKINIEKIEVFVAVSVEHIIKISVLDSSFVTVYQATAMAAGTSGQVLTIDLDSVSYIIGGQHVTWNHCFRPYTVTWLE